MEYEKGRIGRTFIVRFDHKDDLINELIKFAELEHIQSAFFTLLGALREGKLVTGPRESVIPPDPIWFGFDDVHEILGIGNIFHEDGKPKIHLHVGAGREVNVKLGCLRVQSEVFMVVEAFVLEVEGISARRASDKEKGFSPLKFGKNPDLE